MKKLTNTTTKVSSYIPHFCESRDLDKELDSGLRQNDKDGCNSKFHCRTRNLFFLILLTFMLLYSNNVFSKTYTLLDWNAPEANGTNWPGWTHYEPLKYDNTGWERNDSKSVSGKIGPIMWEKNDYNNFSNATILTDKRAPSTSEGGCLKVYDLGNGKTYQPSWWLWQSLRGFGHLSEVSDRDWEDKADTSTDRMSMYVKLGNTFDFNGTGDVPVLEMGTYLCHNGSCPDEGPVNNHFYHKAIVNPGAWVHISWDTHPKHLRGVNEYQDNEPRLEEYGVHYYDVFKSFYLQLQEQDTPDTYYLLDEIKLRSSSDLGEPNQNVESICSMSVGYWSQDDHWEIAFRDNTVRDEHSRKYEIRYSTEPITNENYDDATIVQPEDHVWEDSHYTYIWDRWTHWVWTRFYLPDNVEKNNDKLYFAAKDVSTSSDGWKMKDSSSQNIHVITYNLRLDENNSLLPPEQLEILK